MKQAKSMYFGGEIIEASECDYTTSRDLGLICPFCSSAVFVRSESVRTIKKTKRVQLVNAYFAHYPSGNADNWDCEKRSHTKQGRDEIERIKIQAKNQRLRLYNAHLWDMVAADRNISHQMLNRVRSIFGEKWCEQESVLVRNYWGRELDTVYSFIDLAFIDLLEGGSFDSSMRPLLMTEEDYEEEVRQQRQYYLECDRRLHKAICFEIADFLGTNTAGFAFLKIFKASLFFCMAVGGDPVTIRGTKPRAHLAFITGVIVGTHWIEQINQRLDQKLEVLNG